MDIKTFIFLDLETTGLPHLERNTTKITEICLSAVRADHIEKETLPRIQNKINLCLNPEKLIDDKASEITGMTNDLLSDQSIFNTKIFCIIQDFVNIQQKPICFVAHNGDRFDYPILRAEINNSKNELSGDILSVDSIEAFKKLPVKTSNGRYALNVVYKELTGKEPENAHRAECDVDLLIECATVVGKKFVNWCNSNAKQLTDIPMLKPK